MVLGRFSKWLWPGSTARVAAAQELASFPDFPSGFREPDTVTFLAGAGAGAGGGRPRAATNQRSSRGEEDKVDKEFDMVIVSESDDSEWAIGWLEQQGPGLQSDGDDEASFAVLVRCYRHGHAEPAGKPEGRFLRSGGGAFGISG